MKRILLLFLAVFFSASLTAQTGEIQGKVLDPELGEGLPFATVTTVVQGTLTGAQTDFDGFYSIKPLPPGSYEVTVKYVGYQTQVIKDVLVSADKSTFLDIEMSPEASMIETVVVTEYRVPLLKADETSTGATVTKEDIENLPTRNVQSIASTTAGVYKDDESGDVNVKGSRSEATDYYIDGVKVRGSTAIPASAIEQMSVVTGGVPAKYGDATGGIINITTRGPSREFHGGIEVLSSKFLDPYDYNLIGGNISGPILKKNKGTEQERAMLGFIVSAEYQHEKDDFPSYLGVDVVKDSVKQALIDNPLVRSNNSSGFLKSADFLTADDFENLDARPSLPRDALNGTFKVDFQPVRNLNFTVGGSYNYNKGGVGLRSAFIKDVMRRMDPLASEHLPVYTDNTYRLFARFTQRFGGRVEELVEGEEEKGGLFSNAFYSIQIDYTRDRLIREDPIHKDNLFNYGYIGRFDIDRAPVYSQGPVPLEDSNGVPIPLTGPDGQPLSLSGRIFEGFQETGVTFTGDLENDPNPVGIQHNNALQELAGGPGSFNNLAQWQSNLGLLNGGRPVTLFSVYSLYYMPGVGFGSYLEDDNDQYRLVFNGSADIKKPGASDRNKHAIEFGFEYEQRIDRRFFITADDLWDRMRRIVSNPGLDIVRDLENPILVIDGEEIPLAEYSDEIHGAFSIYDTVRYDFTRLEDSEGNISQSFFDEQVREQFGYGSFDFVNIDQLTPDELSLDMFSPEDLFGSGTQSDNLVDYYGFDHTGKKLSSQPAFEDFFKRDEDGRLIGAIGAFRPVYAAAYIQDKFAYKDLNFNVGLRVDRFDANQKVPKDPYSLYGTRKAGEVTEIEGVSVTHPETIGDDFVVYVDDPTNPSPNIKGYRDGQDWYTAEGVFTNDPRILAESGNLFPYLTGTLNDGNPEDDIQDPDFDLSTAFEDYAPQYSWMPRIAFSFNISDEAQFFAHYSVLTQRPQSRVNAFAEQYYHLSASATGRLFNNPNLRPEKTIDYQIGFKQKLSRSSVLSIAAFYREMRDMIQIIAVPFAYPVTSYTTFGNLDFGTVKGFEISYDLRRTGNVRLTANYTLQFADGTGSADNGAENQVNSGQANIRAINPLDFDARHSFNINFDFRFKDGSKYNGPRIGGLDLFANAGANFIVQARSGTPYTQQAFATPEGQFGVAGRPQTFGSINGSRLPWNYRVDMRLDKDFKLTKKKDGRDPLYINAYLQVQNLLNTENIVNVYSYTGSASDDGYLTSPEGQTIVNSQLSPDSFTELYRQKVNNPTNYGLPRRIRLGVAFSF